VSCNHPIAKRCGETRLRPSNLGSGSLICGDDSSSERRTNRRADCESPVSFNYPRLPLASFCALSPRSPFPLQHTHRVGLVEQNNKYVCPIQPLGQCPQWPHPSFSARSYHSTTLPQREGCEDTGHCMLSFVIVCRVCANTIVRSRSSSKKNVFLPMLYTFARLARRHKSASRHIHP
jgi:hypothetical protein